MPGVTRAHRTVGLGTYLHAQRAHYLAAQAESDAGALAEIASHVLVAAIDRCAGVSDAGTRNARGLTAGATYGAELAAIGGSAGPWGAAIGFVVGFAAGLTSGVWPVDREHFRGQFKIMIAGFTPGLRMRLWPYFSDFAAHCRINDGNGPLTQPWRITDTVNVNSFGSNQILVEWMREDLMASDWMPYYPPGIDSPILQFDDLPWAHRYAWGIVASSADDGAWIGDVGLARNFGHTGDAVDFEPNRTLIHPEMRAWLEQWHDKITCGAIRQSLIHHKRGSIPAMPNITSLPRDPESLALLRNSRSVI